MQHAIIVNVYCSNGSHVYDCSMHDNIFRNTVFTFIGLAALQLQVVTRVPKEAARSLELVTKLPSKSPTRQLRSLWLIKR